MDPYPLFLNAVPIEELPDDELEDFADGLALRTRESVAANEGFALTEAWVRAWARAESERQRRGMDAETLFERVN